MTVCRVLKRAVKRTCYPLRLTSRFSFSFSASFGFVLSRLGTETALLSAVVQFQLSLSFSELTLSKQFPGKWRLRQKKPPLRQLKFTTTAWSGKVEADRNLLSKYGETTVNCYQALSSATRRVCLWTLSSHLFICQRRVQAEGCLGKIHLNAISRLAATIKCTHML